jgi:RNA polymerase sigma-70 factor (ECF subfamily)
MDPSPNREDPPVADLDDLAGFRNYLLMLARAGLRERSRTRRDPSDVVNQTLLEAHRDRGQFRGMTRGELLGWLQQILANNLANVGRHDTRKKRDVRREVPLCRQVHDSSAELVEALVDPGSSPSRRADRNEQSVRLAAVLGRLPADQREAVELRYLHGWPVKAIAEYMERNTPAVGGLLHRGLTRLRELLAAASHAG